MLLSDLLPDVAVVSIDGPLDRPVAGLAYDSRQVVPGGLFVAIRGFHVDGHQYLGQAAARGAAALVVDARHWDGAAPAGATLVRVADSRVALAPLAAAFYGHPARRLRTIGVTGTKGKSTTTDLISQLLDGAGHRSGLISTVDFKIGPRRWANRTRQSTPEAPEVQSLLREMADAGCDYAVIEATSHALSARWNRLGGCEFDVAVFLNITHEHLDYHGTFAQYRADKMRLFELLGEGGKSEVGRQKAEVLRLAPSAQAQAIAAQPTPPHPKWAIVNADDPNHPHFLAAAPAQARRLTYAIHAPAEVRALDVRAGPAGSQLRVETPWGAGDLRLRLPGSFNVANALAALSAALCQGVPFDRALAALEAARSPRGRMVPIALGQPFSVIVDYAHSPDSFEQVMGMLRPLTAGRMIAVFGSAGERDVAKRPIQGAIAARFCELLVLTDEDPRGEDRMAIIEQIAEGAAQAGKREGEDCLLIPDRAEAIRAAMALARPGDLVLLLGKGHEGNIIYADHSQPWDEAAEAERALRELGYGS